QGGFRSPRRKAALIPRPEGPPMLIVAGTISFDPSKTEEARAAVSKMMAATHEEAGNIEYVFSIDMTDPGVMRLFEVWESQDALDAHFVAPHMEEFGVAVRELGVTGRDLLKYQVSSTGPVR
ncbi:MAG: putative quinol monooxygenase, partial [Acidimicrobiales bacterium]